MARYIIESKHTQADCLKAIDAYFQAGARHLAITDWGCEAGVHTGWTIIEAASDEDARLMVPPVIRHQAQLVRLNKFTVEQVRAFHRAARVA
jgi:hypothetical protein